MHHLCKAQATPSRNIVVRSGFGNNRLLYSVVFVVIFKIPFVFREFWTVSAFSVRK